MRKESFCSPLLREGGVRGGEARGGSDEGSAATGEAINKVRLINILFVIGYIIFFSTTPDPSPSVANGDSLPFVGPQPYRWLL